MCLLNYPSKSYKPLILIYFFYYYFSINALIIYLLSLSKKTFCWFYFQYLEKKGIKDLQREHFSFSTKVFIGDFLKPTGQRCNENGDEKYVRLSEKEMFEDIDKLRRENGWKPRRRGSKTASGGGGGGSGGTTTAGGAAVSSGTTTAGSGNNSKNSGGNSSHSILSGLEGLHSSQQKSLAETLLQKLQTEMQLRPDQQESFRLQQEALRYVLKKRW